MNIQYTAARIAPTAFFVAGFYEAILAIPIIGGTITLISGWTTLQTALVIHLVALAIALAAEPRRPLNGSLWGITASILGVIPIIGWALHVVAAIVNLSQAAGLQIFTAQAFRSQQSMRNLFAQMGNQKNTKAKAGPVIKDAEFEEK